MAASVHTATQPATQLECSSQQSLFFHTHSIYIYDSNQHQGGVFWPSKTYCRNLFPMWGAMKIEFEFVWCHGLSVRVLSLCDVTGCLQEEWTSALGPIWRMGVTASFNAKCVVWWSYFLILRTCDWIDMWAFGDKSFNASTLWTDLPALVCRMKPNGFAFRSAFPSSRGPVWSTHKGLSQVPLNVKGQIVKGLARPGNRSDKLFPHLTASANTISTLIVWVCGIKC